MASCCSSEFTYEKICLLSDTDAFATSKWLRDKWFLVWRISVALYFVITNIVALRYSHFPWSLIYMTEWSYIVSSLYFVMSALVSAIHYYKQGINRRSNSYELKNIYPLLEISARRGTGSTGPHVLFEDNINYDNHGYDDADGLKGVGVHQGLPTSQGVTSNSVPNKDTMNCINHGYDSADDKENMMSIADTHNPDGKGGTLLTSRDTKEANKGTIPKQDKENLTPAVVEDDQKDGVTPSGKTPCMALIKETNESANLIKLNRKDDPDSIVSEPDQTAPGSTIPEQNKNSEHLTLAEHDTGKKDGPIPTANSDVLNFANEEVVTLDNVYESIDEQSREGSIRTRDSSTIPCPANTLPWYIKSFWVLFNINSALSMSVSLVYWPLMFRGYNQSHWLSIFTDINLHALNSIFMLIENFLSSVPYHFVHFYHPMLFVISYLFFTVIYWIFGGKNFWGGKYIYYYLNYEFYPGTAIVMMLVYLVLIVPASFGLHYLVYKLRCKLLLRYGQTGSTKSENENVDREVVMVNVVPV